MATCLQQPPVYCSHLSTAATCLQQPLVYCHSTGPMPYTSTTEPSTGKVISKFNHPQVGKKTIQIEKIILKSYGSWSCKELWLWELISWELILWDNPIRISNFLCRLQHLLTGCCNKQVYLLHKMGLPCMGSSHVLNNPHNIYKDNNVLACSAHEQQQETWWLLRVAVGS